MGGRRLPTTIPPEAPRRPTSELALENIEQRAAHYVDAAYADNTRRAYNKNWAAFECWCAGAGLCSLPASPHTLELYLTHLAEKGLCSSTIRRPARRHRPCSRPRGARPA
jgi:hypothetical protein